MKDRMILKLSLLMILLSFVLSCPMAFAKKEGMPGGFEKGQKTGWGESQVPPGWSHGEKKGWDGQTTPPGLPEPEPPEGEG